MKFEDLENVINSTNKKRKKILLGGIFTVIFIFTDIIGRNWSSKEQGTVWVQMCLSCWMFSMMKQKMFVDLIWLLYVYTFICIYTYIRVLTCRVPSPSLTLYCTGSKVKWIASHVLHFLLNRVFLHILLDQWGSIFDFSFESPSLYDLLPSSMHEKIKYKFWKELIEAAPPHAR